MEEDEQLFGSLRRDTRWINKTVYKNLDLDTLLTHCRLSLRLVNKSPEDIIFTTFFQESFPAVYNFDANKPRVELIKDVHPRQVTRTTTYLLFRFYHFRVCLTPTPRPQSLLTSMSSTPPPRVTGPRSRSVSHSGPSTPRTQAGDRDTSTYHSTILCRKQQMTRGRRHQSGPPSVFSTRNKTLRVAGNSASL